MRKKIVAGNWKMNKDLQGTANLVAEINRFITRPALCDIIIFPPFPFISAVSAAFNGSGKYVGAQNISDKESGAFTGEVSASMIKSVGATYTLIGHSERRNYFNETNEILIAKVELALKNGLTPVFCVGEKLEERNNVRHFEIIDKQLKETIFNLDELNFSKCVVAYEPVWAIGTGVTATKEQAEEMHAFIRNLITEKFNPSTANAIRILYGGSCNAKNASELFSMPNIDGGLIGGASLVAEDFSKIIYAA